MNGSKSSSRNDGESKSISDKNDEFIANQHQKKRDLKMASKTREKEREMAQRQSHAKKIRDLQKWEEWKQYKVVNNLKEGTAVCTNWGSVKESSCIDDTAEWRNFGGDNGQAHSSGDRTGGNINMNLEGSGIETAVTGVGSEANALKKAGQKFVSASDRNIMLAMSIMSNFAKQLNLIRKWKEYAIDIYACAEKNGILKGKSSEAKLAACIFMASKISEFPRSLRELIKTLRVKRKDVTFWYKRLWNNLHNVQAKLNWGECIGSICSKLETPHSITEAWKQWIEIVIERELLTGKNPNTVAGAIVYLIAEHAPKAYSFTDLSYVTGMAESTLSLNYRILQKYRTEIIPAWYLATLNE